MVAARKGRASLEEDCMEQTRKPARKPRAAATARPAAGPATAKGKSAARKTVAKASSKPAGPSPAEREAMIRTIAYLRAERRGFAPGYEWEDWLAAEVEVGARPAKAVPPRPRKAPARKTGK
jgi:hypothetical protein